MTRRTVTALLLAGAISAAWGVAVATPASAATDVIIQNQGNLKCLEPLSGLLDPGVPIVQAPCVPGRAEQLWNRVFDGSGSGVLQYRNKATSLCMDARGGATNGTPIQQWTCNTISNEKWTDAGFVPAFTRVLSRVSGSSSHCLDNPLQGNADNAGMQLFACNGTVAQQWFIG